MLCAIDCRVLRRMDVQCIIFKLLLFQMLVTWCGAKHVAFDDALLVAFKRAEVENEVQDNIRNLVHTGIYSHRHLDPSRAEVTIPLKVTSEGELLSRDLEHEHSHTRSRRDVNENEQEHTLHYNITIGGRDLRLDLRPSVSFITPALIVERHTAEGRTRHRPQTKAATCHYTGEVRGQPYSSLALSACDGITGLLRTEQGEYWIEPSNKTPNDKKEGRPHVIFKRSAVDKEDAWHRNNKGYNDRLNYYKSLHRNVNNNNPNQQRNYGNHKKELDMTPRRNYEEYLVRRRQAEELRKKSHEPRGQGISQQRRPLTQQMQRRRQPQSYQTNQRKVNSYSKSNSVESNPSSEEFRKLNTTSSLSARNEVNNTIFRNRLGQKGKGNKDQRQRRINGRRRRRRRAKNCATKEPPRTSTLQWTDGNGDFEIKRRKALKRIKNHRRPSHHHQLSHRPEFEENRRTTRSVSKPRHVEVLLVADKSMTDFHEKGSLETYLLTIMNMVSSLYMDPTIGNYIKVVVVKIILVEDNSAAPELEVSTNADSTLASFCRWQQHLNPNNDTHPHHHDVAILVTRRDICSRHDTPCSTLGVAHVAGMCQPDRSCSVNEDNGITLAHTITHELGHNFGLYHDTEKIGCHRREGSTLHIMTPIFEADTVEVAWSRCSRRDVTNFLDAGLGECLGDRPSHEEYSYPKVPAGVMFDAATQCHLQFGAEAAVCAEPTELCQHLWCLVNNTCKTMLRPAAPGTTCGEDMWCQNQKCVPRAPSPAPRHGGWGEWSEWSECSRTCGGGVSTQSRECNSPEPSNNGRYCIGERSRYKVCNKDSCPKNEPNFREVQCSKYDNTTYNNETILKWIPYFDPDKPCELSCVPPERNDIEMLGGFVADGTPCKQNDDGRDMCIAGVCHKVGCDWIVDSEAEDDACGICGGNGSACKTVQGIYSKGTTKQAGFSEVAVIPAGSRNVKIQEKVNPGNFIKIGSAKTNKVYLNGTRNTTLTEYFVAGSPAIYERDRDWEKVRIPGPIREDIKVYQRIYRGRHRNPGVTYQYTVDRHSSQPRYRWRLSDWSSCSVTCGAGTMRRHLTCIDENNNVIEQGYCYHIESPRHTELMQQCIMEPCPATPPTPRALPATHWWVGPWSYCSKSCQTPGKTVTKQRNVYCVDRLANKVTHEKYCDAQNKPRSIADCNDLPKCY